ncbi:MAG TPA: hypothetical protein VN829_11780 [Dongiaceae bacterium]|nr:hypothetical protein [Dongiaceae bacterium]
MSADELRNLLRANPFQPFTVYLPSDKPFTVPHPEFAALTPPGRTLVVFHGEDNGFDLLDVRLISRVELHEASSSGE